MPVSFCTPLMFSSWNHYTLSTREKVLTHIEEYFLLKQSDVFVILPPADPSKPFHRTGYFKTIHPSFSSTVIKVLSYLTLIIPLLILLAKFILRWPYKHLSKTPNPFSLITEKPFIQDPISPSSTSKSSLSPALSPFKDLDPSDTYPETIEGTSPSIIRRGTPPDHPHLPHVHGLKSKNPNTLDENTVIACLQKVLPHLIKRSDHESIIYIHKDSHSLVFELKEIPGIIFKKYINPLCTGEEFFISNRTNLYYDWLEKMESHFQQYHYKHLYLPKSRKFCIKIQAGPHPDSTPAAKNEYNFIAQEKMPLYPSADTALVWKIHDTELQKAFKELSLVIQRTGANYSSAPFCSPFYHEGRWFLALLDMPVAHTDDCITHLKELVGNLFSETSMAHVSQTIASTSKSRRSSLQLSIDNQQQRIEVLAAHETFHLQKQTAPYQSISLRINLKELAAEIDLEEATLFTIQTHEETILMKDVVIALGKELNLLLEQAKNHERLHLHRVILDPQSPLSFPSHYSQLRSKNSPICDLHCLWIRRILTALVKTSALHSWKELPRDRFSPSWVNKLEIWI